MPVTFGSESREMHASADLHIVPEVIYWNSYSENLFFMYV